MKIVITGGTGFIGSALVETLLKRGDNLIIASRSQNPKIPEGARSVRWNPEDLSHIVAEVDGADAVINLAGDPIVGKRWNAKQKRKILESRTNTTHIVANSIKKAVNKPKVLINASAVGFYGPRDYETLSEEARAGVGFLSDTCKAWEAHAIRVEDFNVRVIRLRTGIVLDKDGGALKMMLSPFKMFIGGWLGNGNQWMSWIAREDLVRLVVFCLENQEAKGAINAVTPQPVTNKAFSMVLAQVLKRPCLLPVPEFALKVLLGEMSEMLLTGQRVIPKKAQDLGFSFQFPEIRHALESILH